MLPNNLKPFTHADLLRRCSRLQKIRSVLNDGQFVSQAVRASRADSDQDLAWMLSREGRVGLSVDGLLADPSLFATDIREMTQNPSHVEAEKPRPARGFSAQVRNVAERLHKGGRP